MDEKTNSSGAWSSIIRIGRNILGRLQRENQNDASDSKIVLPLANRHSVPDSKLDPPSSKSHVRIHVENFKVPLEGRSQWWEGKVKQLQYHADTNNMKGFYGGLKVVRGPI